MTELWIFRAVLVAAFSVLSFKFAPFGLTPIPAGLLGALFAVAIVCFEIRLNRISARQFVGAAVGLVLGILGAYLATLVVGAALDSPATPHIQLSILLLLAYLGLIVGGGKGYSGSLPEQQHAPPPIEEAKKPSYSAKILDTSVIIDGRIADVAEAGFLDGTLVIPQFVLWELQTVADSSDSSKRNRGRRGLDILQRMQKVSNLTISIVENDYPKLKEVDLKLIELAKEIGGKIVTNDFNLNKVARLHGVSILNLNELANALKPVVLPGELMQVFIIKEGKEYNQGVAYLDDGTMVVVDNARKFISQNIEISVTSVLQTTAGKMIFGRYDERGVARQSSGQFRPPSSGSHRSRGSNPDQPGLPVAEPGAEDARQSGTHRSGVHKVEHAGR